MLNCHNCYRCKKKPKEMLCRCADSGKVILFPRLKKCKDIIPIDVNFHTERIKEG